MNHLSSHKTHMHPLNTAQRLIVGIGLPMCVLLVFLYIKYGTGDIPCVFYKLTGLYCAGCGSGRAVAAILDGHFREAFSYNCMLFLLGIPCIIIIIREYVRIVIPSAHRKPVRVPAFAAWMAAGLLVLFWILRNIPAFSFLAP